MVVATKYIKHDRIYFGRIILHGIGAFNRLCSNDYTVRQKILVQVCNRVYDIKSDVIVSSNSRSWLIVHGKSNRLMKKNRILIHCWKYFDIRVTITLEFSNLWISIRFDRLERWHLIEFQKHWELPTVIAWIIFNNFQRQLDKKIGLPLFILEISRFFNYDI